MSEKNRKYKFTWESIGSDLAVARPSLGHSTRLEVYRLFQFTLRDIIEQDYGTEVADDLFRRAGVLAGREFYLNFCSDVSDIPSLVKKLQELLKEFAIGIFRVESFDPETLSCVVTVDEDLDCSGLPETGDEICVYDEGFIKGILDTYSGKDFDVHEIDCWCTGARTCRFSATPKE